MSEQEKPKLIIGLQGILILAIALGPFTQGLSLVPPDGFLDWLGIVLSLMGTSTVVVSVLALKKSFTVGAEVKENTTLATSFPFNFSRNPMYVGGLLMCFSWSLLQRSWITFALTIILGIVLNTKVKIEEKNLEMVFGESYLRYKKSVRRFL